MAVFFLLSTGFCDVAFARSEPDAVNDHVNSQSRIGEGGPLSQVDFPDSGLVGSSGAASGGASPGTDFQSRRLIAAPVDENAAMTETNDVIEQAVRVPAAPGVAQRIWVAPAGTSLKAIVAEWAGKERYELVWDASYDYPIVATVKIQGDFVSAISQIFDSYATADRPLSVDIYQGQRLVHVKARGEGIDE
ncbi:MULTISPECIES: toxin co-regulated pilus biosynthesis Q family protein [Pandoraea]|nr:MULTISPECIES: toxin co-regulated pilus biosynthesis Q family protein [Pandoraea]